MSHTIRSAQYAQLNINSKKIVYSSICLRSSITSKEKCANFSLKTTDYSWWLQCHGFFLNALCVIWKSLLAADHVGSFFHITVESELLYSSTYQIFGTQGLMVLLFWIFHRNISLMKWILQSCMIVFLQAQI